MSPPDQPRMPTVQLVGDGIHGEWATWRWSDGTPGGMHRVDRRRWRSLSQRLRAALPGHDARGGEVTGLDGELTDPEGEESLMRELAQILLPAELRLRLVGGAAAGERICLRVAPSPGAAVVPWPLLCLDETGTRVLDAADVSWIAPLLPRDVAASGSRVPRPWDEVRDRHVLRIIDPVLTDPVLDNEGIRRWRAAGARHIQTRVGRDDLAADLADVPSRLFLLGHCSTPKGPGSTGFLLSDSWGGRPLTGADIVSAAGSGWPMPPRVALVACASGADYAGHEPFGLVTAMMVAGAETVQATLWPLPSDEAYRLRGAGPALCELASAVDEAQASDDPTAAWCAWQRDRLTRWRSGPRLDHAPVLWASVATITAPTCRRIT